MSLFHTISTFLNQLIKKKNFESFTIFYSMMNLMLSLLQLLFCKLHKSLFCKFHKLCKLHNSSQLSQSCHTKTELLINSFKNNFLTNQHFLSVQIQSNQIVRLSLSSCLAVTNAACSMLICLFLFQTSCILFLTFFCH